jgi:uncharacterized protein YfcZ (UPF0381/DUF406 family)
LHPFETRLRAKINKNKGKIKMKKFISARSRYYKKSSVSGLIGHIMRKFNFNKNVLSAEFIKYENVYSGDIQKEFEEQLEEAKFIHFERHHQYFRKKSNLYIEFVVPFSEEHFFTQYENNKEKFIENIENMIKSIEEKYKIKGLGYSLHLDEGYIRGDKVFYNPHFHLSFLNFDFDSGLMPWGDIKRDEFSNFQDIAFESFENLGFERGKSKSETKKEHLEKDEWIDFKQSQEIFQINDTLEQLELRKIELEEILKGYDENNNFLEKVINGEMSLEELDKLKKQDDENPNLKFKTVLNSAYRYVNGQKDIEKTKINLKRLNENYSKLGTEKEQLLNEMTQMTSKIRDFKNEYTEISKKINDELSRLTKLKEKFDYGTKELEKITNIKNEETKLANQAKRTKEHNEKETEILKKEKELLRSINHEPTLNEEIEKSIKKLEENSGYWKDKEKAKQEFKKEITELVKFSANGQTKQIIQTAEDAINHDKRTIRENEELNNKVRTMGRRKEDLQIAQQAQKNQEIIDNNTRLTAENTKLKLDKFHLNSGIKIRNEIINQMSKMIYENDNKLFNKIKEVIIPKKLDNWFKEVLNIGKNSKEINKIENDNKISVYQDNFDLEM